MFLTGSCPQLRVLVRPEFLHDLKAPPTWPVEADVVGLKSLKDRALGFHVLLRNGAQFWGLPVHALCWMPGAPSRWALDQLQLWDCPSYHFTAHRFARLQGLRCEVRLKGHAPWVGGRYVFTVDWCHPDPLVADAGFSEVPAESKCAHLVALHDGNFCLLPNHRMRWVDPAFVTEPFPARPTYLTQTTVWRCEGLGSTPPTGEFFYEPLRDPLQPGGRPPGGGEHRVPDQPDPRGATGGDGGPAEEPVEGRVPDQP